MTVCVVRYNHLHEPVCDHPCGYKGENTDFSSITQADLGGVMKRLINRPRKCLDLKTPNQVAVGLTPDFALGI